MPLNLSRAELRRLVLDGDSLEYFAKKVTELRPSLSLGYSTKGTTTGRFKSDLLDSADYCAIVVELFTLAALAQRFEVMAYLAANHLSYNPRVGWPLAAVARLEVAIVGVENSPSVPLGTIESLNAAIEHLRQCDVKRRAAFPTLWQHIQTEEPT